MLTGWVSVKPAAASGELPVGFDYERSWIDKLDNAVKKAKMMVQVTIKDLTEYMGSEAMRTAGLPGRNFDEVENALAKYFNLRMATMNYSANPVVNRYKYWGYVEGVLEVYNSISRGFSVPYEILIYSQKKKADGSFEHGHVLAGRGMDSALMTMLAKPDPMGHVPWGTVKTSEIHLNVEWFNSPAVDDDDVARTIVHEASHKWAYTNDILYKSNSYRSSLADDPGKLDDAVQLGMQETIPRAGAMKMAAGVGGAAPQPKPIYRMMGEKDIKPLELLRNADSYAWVARRLWKKAGRPL